MSWFKRDSPLRSSFSRFSSAKADSSTCYETFKNHWSQANDVIEQQWAALPGSNPLNVDNVTIVVSNLGHMITLLLQETSSLCPPQGYQVNKSETSSSQHDNWIMGPILDYLLTEGILDKLYTWSLCSGEFINIMKLEQLKIYEVLVSHSHHNLLFQKPVIRPLLQLLNECKDSSPLEVEKRLIVLLNTLCVCLSQHPELLEVFFSASSEQEPARFLIFSLLIPYVHREGAIGQQARDALLLCMALSRKNGNIGSFIAEHSNFCPVLATGLSGLYSALPRKLVVVSDDWHYFTPEEIQDMPELEMFLNSLEFCNAVIQVAHNLVGEQLLEYIYQGFLLPVLGPALSQTTMEEVMATTAYLELSLRSITEPSLIQLFLKFILTACFEDKPIIDVLVRRIENQSKLSLVTMGLFRTLLDMNCEDVVFELILKFLIPCSHVMVSQRCRVRDLDVYCQTAEKLLSLIPSCCLRESSLDASNASQTSLNSSGYYSPSPLSPDSSFDSPNLNGSLRIKRHQRTSSTSSFTFGDNSQVYRLFASQSNEVPDSVQASYQNYLNNAHKMLLACNVACRCWSAPYDGYDPAAGSVSDNSRGASVVSNASSNEVFGLYESKQNGATGSSSVLRNEYYNTPSSLSAGLSPTFDSPESNDNLSPSFSSIASYGGASDVEEKNTILGHEFDGKNEDELPPLIKADDIGKLYPNHNVSRANSVDGKEKESSSTRTSQSRALSSNENYGTPDIGPFLTSLLSRLEMMMQNDVYTNLQLTGLITRLAMYPQPLIRSFLLNHSLVFQPSVRSLIQILTTLKQKVDSYSYSVDNFDSVLVKAKQFLAAREERLLKNGPPRVYAEAAIQNKRNSLEISRGDQRRRSLTNFLFRKNVMGEAVMESIPDCQGYRYVSNPKKSPGEGQLEYIKTRNAALCAIIFEEFVKELAAVTQEHALIQADPDFINF